MPVDQIMIISARHIGDVGRVHQHLAPHNAFGHWLVFTLQQACHRLFALVKIARFLLLLGEVGVRMGKAPVGQHQHMLPVIFDRVRARWINDQRAIHAHRFLHMAMAVIPISAMLPHQKFISEGLAWPNARKADARHAVHLERQQHAVPMYRGILLQCVADDQLYILALAQPHQRSGQSAVDGISVSGFLADLES